MKKKFDVYKNYVLQILFIFENFSNYLVFIFWNIDCFICLILIWISYLLVTESS